MVLAQPQYLEFAWDNTPFYEICCVREIYLFQSEEAWNVATLLGSTMSPASRARLVELYANVYLLLAAIVNHLVWEWFEVLLDRRVAGHEPPLPSYLCLLRPPTTIPLSALIHPPRPFELDNAEEGVEHLLLSHLHAVAVPAFLVDGEWAGYTLETDARRLAPWMHCVHFQATETADSIHLHADDARQGALRFSLQGNIDRRSGLLRMRKQFVAGSAESWHWSGFLTPFGMVGTWDTKYWHSGERKGCWFWLWKRAWSKPWAEEA